MSFLCKVCDKDIFENEPKNYQYMATLTKENDKSFYENYSITNPNLNEIEKILNDYITRYKKEFHVSFINWEFYIDFDKNFKIHIESFYCISVDDLTKIKSFLLFWIEYYKLQGRGYKEMIFKTIGDKCQVTCNGYINKPMHMVERRLNLVVAKNPQLINSIDQNMKHRLVRKYSHIPFNI